MVINYGKIQEDPLYGLEFRTEVLHYADARCAEKIPEVKYRSELSDRVWNDLRIFTLKLDRTDPSNAHAKSYLEGYVTALSTMFDRITHGTNVRTDRDWVEVCRWCMKNREIIEVIDPPQRRRSF